MGMNTASGGSVHVTGSDGRERVLRVLTMGQLAELAGWWKSQLRKQLLVNLDLLGVTVGQRIAALDDFERHEPTYWEVIRWGQSPTGVDRVCAAAAGEDTDVVSLGSPLERTEIANQLLQLMPADPQALESLPDPLPVPMTGIGGETAPSSDGSTASIPGA